MATDYWIVIDDWMARDYWKMRDYRMVKDYWTVIDYFVDYMPINSINKLYTSQGDDDFPGLYRPLWERVAKGEPSKSH